MVIQFYEKRVKYCKAKKYLPKYGSSLYLPQKTHSGDGLGDIINWISSNASTIGNIGSVVGNVANAAGSVSKTAIDTIRGIEEVKRLQALRKQIIPVISEVSQERILNSIPQRGSGFKMINNS